MKRLKAEDYTKWLRCDLWTLQQALFLLLGVEPPDDYFNPDGSAYSYYESYESRYSKVAKSYKEYLELADDAISLRTLTPFSIHEYTAPIHAMKFHPRHILAWAQNKQLNIPEPLAPILNKTSPYPPESTSLESRRAEGKAITSQRNERLQQDAERLAREQPAWNKGKIAFELSKRPGYMHLKAETIERNVRTPTNRKR